MSCAVLWYYAEMFDTVALSFTSHRLASSWCFYAVVCFRTRPQKDRRPLPVASVVAVWVLADYDCQLDLHCHHTVTAEAANRAAFWKLIACIAHKKGFFI